MEIIRLTCTNKCVLMGNPRELPRGGDNKVDLYKQMCIDGEYLICTCRLMFALLNSCIFYILEQRTYQEKSW